MLPGGAPVEADTPPGGYIGGIIPAPWTGTAPATGPIIGTGGLTPIPVIPIPIPIPIPEG